MAVINKDSRFPQLYVDPYEEPSVSLALTPPSDLPQKDESQTTTGSGRQQSLNDAAEIPGRVEIPGTVEIPDSRPPGDGASARRDVPPLSIPPLATTPADDDDEPFLSPCADGPPTAVSDSPPPPLLPRNVVAVPENPSAGNYDEPWDLASKFRQLEEKFCAVPILGQGVPAAATRPGSQSSSSEADTRVLADGYDQPWDLLPHRRDARDDVGYDKPWDLKPHEKDVRASVAGDGDYDAPWDVKPRSFIEREVMAAKSAKEAAAGRPTPGPRAPVPNPGPRASAPAPGLKPELPRPPSASQEASQSSDGSHQKPQYDEPWDQKQKQLVSKVVGSSTSSLSWAIFRR